MDERQERTKKAFEQNGWLHTVTFSSGIIVMEITDVNPESEKETPLMAYIDLNGSSRIV